VDGPTSLHNRAVIVYPDKMEGIREEVNQETQSKRW
jgi:hypothetical protein